MRPRTAFAAGAVEALKALLNETNRLDEYRRIQCVYLRAVFDEGNARIAATTGLSIGTIRNIHARYLRYGIDALKTKPKGGRWRENLSVDAERAVVEPFLKLAEQSGVVEIEQVKQVYETQVGRAVAPSTPYRVLRRHGWRKAAARPSQQDAAVEAGDAIEKAAPPPSIRRKTPP
jgi:transposase